MQERSAEGYARDHLEFLRENGPDVLAQLASPATAISLRWGSRRRTGTVPYHVQNLPYLEQVQALQSRRHESDEIVRPDLIYQQLPDADAD
jgi:hypothetical protein